MSVVVWGEGRGGCGGDPWPRLQSTLHMASGPAVRAVYGAASHTP